MGACELDIVMEVVAATLGYHSLKEEQEKAVKTFVGHVCPSSNMIWQVAMLRATAAYFRQTERGGGKEVNCDDSVAIDSPQEGPV